MSKSPSAMSKKSSGFNNDKKSISPNKSKNNLTPRNYKEISEKLFEDARSRNLKI